MTPPITNPYHPGPPVTDSEFYGRADLLKSIRRDLEKTNVVLLQGQRRIGKTSFLRKIQSILTNKAEDGNSFLPISFDIQPYIGDTLPMFQLHLAQAIAAETPAIAPDPSTFTSDPKAFQKKWLPKALKACGDRRVILLVDEFDNLGEIRLNRAIDSILSFIATLVSDESSLKWILAVGRQIGSLPIQYDAIISQATKVTLGRLTPTETERLVVEPVRGMLSFTPEAVERIYQLTCGQPHFIQALCSEIFDRVLLDESRDTAGVDDVNLTLSGFVEHYESAITSIVRGVPPLNERVLIAVAKITEDGRPATRRAIVDLLVEHNISLSTNELSGILEQLVEWDLLTTDGPGWRFSVEVVRMYVAGEMSLEMGSEQAIDVLEARVNSRVSYAEKARKAGLYSVAIDEYREALKLEPTYRESLLGLAKSYRQTGDLDGREEVLKTLYAQGEISIREELVEVESELAAQAEQRGDDTAALTYYETLLKLEPGNEIWGRQLAHILVDLNKKRLSKLTSPGEFHIDHQSRSSNYLEENRQKLAEAKKAIKDRLALVFDKTALLSLRRALKAIEDREKIDANLERARNAYQKKDWETVAKYLLVLHKAGVRLSYSAKDAIKKAAYVSLYNNKSFFYRYRFGIARLPILAKDFIGIFLGLVLSLLLTELIPLSGNLGAYVYVALTGIFLWMLRAAGRRRQRPFLLGHLVAILSSLGILFLCRSWVEFPPTSFWTYFGLLLIMGVPLAQVNNLDTPDGCVYGLTSGGFALIAGAMGGAMIGWLGPRLDYFLPTWLTAGFTLLIGAIFIFIGDFIFTSSNVISIEDAIKILGDKKS